VTEFNEVSSGIDDMINMDEFSGAAADLDKEYFESIHKTTVLAFQQLMIEIDKNLKIILILSIQMLTQVKRQEYISIIWKK